MCASGRTVSVGGGLEMTITNAAESECRPKRYDGDTSNISSRWYKIIGGFADGRPTLGRHPRTAPSLPLQAFTSGLFLSTLDTHLKKMIAMLGVSNKKHRLIHKLQFISRFNPNGICFMQGFLQLFSETLHIFNITNPHTYLPFSLNRCL